MFIILSIIFYDLLFYSYNFITSDELVVSIWIHEDGVQTQTQPIGKVNAR